MRASVFQDSDTCSNTIEETFTFHSHLQSKIIAKRLCETATARMRGFPFSHLSIHFPTQAYFKGPFW